MLPSELVEVIESKPAMVVNCFSSGVATDEAMVSGLAPGRPAETWMVGKSTLGKSLTASRGSDNAKAEDGQHDQAGHHGGG